MCRIDHFAQNNLGDVPDSIKTGCRLIFLQDVFENLTRPRQKGQLAGIITSLPRKPDADDGQSMEAYFALAHAIIDTYSFSPSNEDSDSIDRGNIESIDNDKFQEIKRCRQNGVHDEGRMAVIFHGIFENTPNWVPDDFATLIQHGELEGRPVVQCEDGCDDTAFCSVLPTVDRVAVMNFRWEVARLADFLVARYEMRRPGGKVCLMWPQVSSDSQVERLFKLAHLIKPIEIQGPDFNEHFSCYMAAAFAETGLHMPERRFHEEMMVNEILDYIRWLRDAEVDSAFQLCAKHEGIRESRKKFFELNGGSAEIDNDETEDEKDDETVVVSDDETVIQSDDGTVIQSDDETVDKTRAESDYKMIDESDDESDDEMGLEPATEEESGSLRQ